MKKCSLLFGIILIFSISSTCLASDVKKHIKAMDLIVEFADAFCKKVPLVGSSESTVLSGEAKLKLNSLIKKLANLDITGIAKYDSKSYSGVLQKDLIKALESNKNCRMVIWEDLKGRLLGESEKTIIQGTTNSLIGLQDALLRGDIDELITLNSRGVDLSYIEHSIYDTMPHAIILSAIKKIQQV